jgi:regulator of cell morphogenesis and NO signaling
MVDPNLPVATLVLDHSECAPVFARHRIDYCCKGQRPLTEACAALGLETTSVVAELETAIARRTVPPVDPRALSTRELIGKAIAPHHQYLHRTMPFLVQLATKVARVHGDREPSLHEVARLVETFVAILKPHLAEEESLLFPALIAGRLDAARPMLDSMLREHEQVGALLADLRTAAENYVPPEWACTSYRTLLAELAVLEADTLEHVHLENHALLPRFS